MASPFVVFQVNRSVTSRRPGRFLWKTEILLFLKQVRFTPIEAIRGFSGQIGDSQALPPGSLVCVSASCFLREDVPEALPGEQELLFDPSLVLFEHVFFWRLGFPSSELSGTQF